MNKPSAKRSLLAGGVALGVGVGALLSSAVEGNADAKLTGMEPQVQLSQKELDQQFEDSWAETERTGLQPIGLGPGGARGWVSVEDWERQGQDPSHVMPVLDAEGDLQEYAVAGYGFVSVDEWEDPVRRAQIEAEANEVRARRAGIEAAQREQLLSEN